MSYLANQLRLMVAAPHMLAALEKLLPLIKQELAHRKATGQRGTLQSEHLGNYHPDYAAFATAD